MSKEKCSKNEIFNHFAKKCVSDDSSQGILLNSKSGKYQNLKKKTFDQFLELSIDELKTYCKEMIPKYDCSKIKNKKDLIEIISNKVNIESGELFCKNDEIFDKKNRKCSKKSPKIKSPKKSKSPNRINSLEKYEHNYSIIFLKKARQEDIVTKLSKKNIDKNVDKLNKYIKKMVSDCEKRIKSGKTDEENKKMIISKYFQKHVIPDNILKPLFDELFSIGKYSEENYHLILLMKIFILYILDNNMSEFINKDFEISSKAELKTKMYFKKSKTDEEPKYFENSIIEKQTLSEKNNEFNVKQLVEKSEPVTYIKYVDKFLDIAKSHDLVGYHNLHNTYIGLQELLIECDTKFKELLNKNPPRTYEEFKSLLNDFMKNHVLKNEDKILHEFKEKGILDIVDEGDERQWLNIVSLLLVKMLFKNMYVDVSYTSDKYDSAYYNKSV